MQEEITYFPDRGYIRTLGILLRRYKLVAKRTVY